jgi:hypothetical protein
MSAKERIKMKRGKTMLEVRHFIWSRKISSACYSVVSLCVLCVLPLRFEHIRTHLTVEATKLI